MSTSEKFCLKWNDFQENIGTVFGSLWQDEDFSDVTLASEDGHQVEAHKVILASSSPFFQKLLKQNKHTHPLIYMRGIKSEELDAILDFLYHGETNINQENIDSFLKIADELSLKGLTAGTEENKSKSNPKVSQPKADIKTFNSKYSQPIAPEYYTSEQSSIINTLKEKSTEVSTVAVSNISFSGDLHDLDEHVKSLMVPGQNMTPDGKKKATACQVCGKEGYRTNIRDHIETNHVEGVSVPCNKCEKIFRSRNALRQHMYNHK